MDIYIIKASLLIISYLWQTSYSQPSETGQNLALGKPTWQYPPGFGPSERAVDGNIDPYFGHGSCTHTADKQSEEPAVWSVDLEGEFYITMVIIYNRKYHQGRLRHFRLYGYPGNVTLYNDAEQSSPQYTKEVIEILVDSVQQYRNITVYLPTIEGKHTLLNLCEVQIFGGCRVPVLDNGHFTDTRAQHIDKSRPVVPSGTQIQAICSAGHNFIQNDNIFTCGFNYDWDKSDPKCTVITCPQLSLDNGNYAYNQTHVDNFNAFESTATAECNEGFELQGNKQRICLANESWSGDNSECVTIMCVHPGDFDHGYYMKEGGEMYIQHQYVVHNTVIKTICHKGFLLSSNQSNERQCTEQGTWSGNKPICGPVRCVELQNTTENPFFILPLSGHIYPEYGSVVIWACNNYPEFKYQKCYKNGTWSGSYPLCQTNSYAAKADNAQKNFVISVSVNIAFLLVAIALICVVFFLKRKYGQLLQKSAVYMDLSASHGIESRDLYTDISDQQMKENSRKTKNVYENTMC